MESSSNETKLTSCNTFVICTLVKSRQFERHYGNAITNNNSLKAIQH